MGVCWFQGKSVRGTPCPHVSARAPSRAAIRAAGSLAGSEGEALSHSASQGLQPTTRNRENRLKHPAQINKTILLGRERTTSARPQWHDSHGLPGLTTLSPGPTLAALQVSDFCRGTGVLCVGSEPQSCAGLAPTSGPTYEQLPAAEAETG